MLYKYYINLVFNNNKLLFYRKLQPSVIHKLEDETPVVVLEKI